MAETSIRTITPHDYFERYGDENMEIIEYQIYIVQKWLNNEDVKHVNILNVLIQVIIFK